MFTAGKSVTAHLGVVSSLISVILTADSPSAMSCTSKFDGEGGDYCLTVLSFSSVCVLCACFSREKLGEAQAGLSLLAGLCHRNQLCSVLVSKGPFCPTLQPSIWVSNHKEDGELFGI